MKSLMFINSFHRFFTLYLFFTMLAYDFFGILTKSPSLSSLSVANKILGRRIRQEFIGVGNYWTTCSLSRTYSFQIVSKQFPTSLASYLIPVPRIPRKIIEFPQRPIKSDEIQQSNLSFFDSVYQYQRKHKCFSDNKFFYVII